MAETPRSDDLWSESDFSGFEPSTAGEEDK